MSDKEKVNGEEVEVFYECREIGEGDWTPCDLRRYTYCQKQPEMDTRAFVPLYQHTRITEALRGEVVRIESEWKDLYADQMELVQERDQLRAEVERLTTDLEAANSMLIETSKAGIELRAQLAQQQGVPDALREAVEYLDDNRFNSIGAGSILHMAMTDALAAAPAPVQAEPASPWVAVTERLPQIKQVLSEKCTLEGREIPTLYRSGMVLTFDGSRVSAGIIEWFHSKSPLNNVTHWMPLPAAPEVV